ncbi:MAG: hypothetical protein GY842_06025 [bacterium]|nr:hypothetical protein [bacterium]
MSRANLGYMNPRAIPGAIRRGRLRPLGLDDPFGVEGHPSLIRKFVEFMFYLSTANALFLSRTGLMHIRFAGGGVIAVCGALTLFIMLLSRERQPLSVWFIVLINMGANVSQMAHGVMPITGEGLSRFVHWLSNIIMLCYLVRDRATQKRVVLFMTLIILALVSTGALTTEAKKIERLGLEDVGGSMADANRLGMVSALFMITMLFWSLRSAKFFRPALWVLASALLAVIFLTVSRAAVLLAGCGLATLLVAIFAARGMRVGGLILIVVALVATSQLGYLLTDSVDALDERMGQRSSRLAVYSLGTINDLAHTLILGRGLGGGRQTHAGIESHQSFLYTHMVYGGITAYPYLLWLIILSVRLTRLVLARDYPLDHRLHLVALWGVALGIQLFSNSGYTSVACIYAVAMVEKYSASYSRTRIMARRANRPPGPGAIALPLRTPAPAR